MIQRAAIHVQSSGRSEVTGANVLVAIFAERERGPFLSLRDFVTRVPAEEREVRNLVLAGAFDAFEVAVARIPEILECHLMAGTADYLLKVVAEDTEDFARIHRQYLTRLPGVAKMQSSFALRTVFKTTALPV